MSIFKLTNATQEAELNLTVLAALDKKEGKLESARKRGLESFLSSERFLMLLNRFCSRIVARYGGGTRSF